MTIDYGNILSCFYYDKSWRIENSIDYNTLKWNDTFPKPTKEELDLKWNNTLEIIKKQNCKNTAKQKIQNCDWSVLPDVKISNKSEFENYRAILRNYILNPVENPDWTNEPTPIWVIQPGIIGENNG